jgi:hypothetical protein
VKPDPTDNTRATVDDRCVTGLSLSHFYSPLPPSRRQVAPPPVDDDNEYRRPKKSAATDKSRRDEERGTNKNRREEVIGTKDVNDRPIRKDHGKTSYI